jgi:hypothetical protein
VSYDRGPHSRCTFVLDPRPVNVNDQSAVIRHVVPGRGGRRISLRFIIHSKTDPKDLGPLPRKDPPISSGFFCQL